MKGGLIPRLRGKVFVERRVLLYEALGFLSIIIMIWANEILDLPHVLLGSPWTKVNWREAAFESTYVLALAIVILGLTKNFLLQIKYLEGFLIVCAFCKKIRVGEDTWVPIEEFLRDRAEVEFSHSYCPKCLQEHYGHLPRS